MLLARLLPAVLAAPLVAVGCGSGSPVGGTFTIDFPTVADAVATDTVQVFVYPYAAATSCESLFEARKASPQMTPPGSVVQTSTTSPCDLRNGSSSSLSVPFGSYSFLAVAAAGKCSSGDFLIGCAAQTISDTNSVVSIPLTLETNTCAVPATSCTTLSSFCAKGCM